MSQNNNKEGVLKLWDIVKGLIFILHRIPSIAYYAAKILRLDEKRRTSWGVLVEQNAAKYPNRPAVKWGDSSITYREFNELVNQYANYFISQGLQKGDVSIIFLDNRLELLAVYSAISKIGAISSVINTNLRGDGLLHVLKHAPGKFLIIGEEVIDAFNKVKNDIGLSINQKLFYVTDKKQIDLPIDFLDLKREIKFVEATNPPTLKKVMLKDPIAYIYTSGTTGGRPKAAIIVNKRLFSSVYWFGKCIQKTKPSDTVYCPLPFYHTNSLSVGWPTAIANGAAIAIRRKFSVSAFWSDVQKFNATMFIYIGELPKYLFNQPPSPEDKEHSLKKIIGNGLRPDIWKPFKKRFGISNVYELYGASESIWIFSNLLNLDCTVGMNTQTYAIVKCDVDREEPIINEHGFFEKVSVGDIGLLIFKISVRFKFAGYADKEATKAKIFRDVFQKGDVWFNTGDLMRNIGYRHAQFIDRMGDTFRWKGENVSTTEVEKILNTFKQVSESMVYGVVIPGSSGRIGMASIICKTARIDNFDFESLLAHLKNSLPDYAIPKFIRFKNEFESTSTYKIKKINVKKEGFDPNTVDEPLFVLLSADTGYSPLTVDLYNDILSGRHRF
ncbi:MAG: long-chain-acyl-CoA synthetase [Proteobacteria bacterium]|nr:long-chain-acyl-CoA synthetase [Pseudomonadota bacterium]